MAKKKATADDAQVLMQLYDLRRDPVMRTARKYMTMEFWPRNYEEFKAVLTGYGSDQNAYLRQVLTYWDMAAAMVLHGAVNEDLFVDANSEPFFLCAKFGDYLPQARKDNANPELGTHLSALAARRKAKARIKALRDRLDARRATTAGAAKS